MSFPDPSLSTSIPISRWEDGTVAACATSGGGEEEEEEEEDDCRFRLRPGGSLGMMDVRE
jgi:hypothetical protein